MEQENRRLKKAIANLTLDNMILKEVSWRMLTIIDEHPRECLASHGARQIRAVEVIEQLADLFLSRGIPEHLRSDNGSVFTPKFVRGWLTRLGVKTLTQHLVSPLAADHKQGPDEQSIKGS